MDKAAKFSVWFLVVCLFLSTVLYPFCLYTTNPFISHMRTLYIETAMSTLSHQWLATSFIPSDIIDHVMVQRQLSQEAQNDKVSTLPVSQTGYDRIQEESAPKEQFLALFNEIDPASLAAYRATDPYTPYAQMKFDFCDDITQATLLTTRGDQVLALDAAQGIMIVRVHKDEYEGRLAFIKNPARVSVGTAKALFSHGQFIRDIAQRYGAVLAINASGFEDPEGNGNGGTPYGYVKSRGVKKRSAVGGNYKIIGFDTQNSLRVGRFTDTSGFRDAVEFTPALIVDGEQLVKDSAGWGLQPRSAIAQKEDGTVMLLVVDGRQIGHSLGCTVDECANIFMDYDAIQAANLDGGSSSVMYYNGREITKPTTASKNPEGRYLPDAFIVT